MSTENALSDTEALFRHHYAMGNNLARERKFDEAAEHYERALAFHPNYAEAYNNLGNVRKEQKRFEEALACYSKAVVLKPDFAIAHNNLGILLRDLGRLEEANLHHRNALMLNPGYVEAYYNLGNVLLDREQYDAAEDCYRHALSLRPDYAEAYMNLGNALRFKRMPEEALACYRRAAVLKPHYAEAHYNLGNALLERGEFGAAVDCYKHALSIKKDYAEAYMNLGNALVSLDKIEEAIQCYRYIASFRADDAEAHVNEAFARLRIGDFERGWREYEWRWRTRHMEPPALSSPMWKGEDLQGKTILLHCEQGFGDSLQFVRYAPMVKKRGGQVLLVCPPSLMRLFETVPGIDLLISEGENLPHYDCHSPLLSLPMLFETRLETIPSQVPYLYATTDRISLWAERLRPYRGMKIGLVWAGSPRIDQPNAHLIDRRRSMRLDQFSSLATLPGTHFFSLQKGPPAQQAKSPLAGLQLVDFMDEVNDFADTAALIANLDLVIGVDTSAIHLAGAMGKPVWMLSRFDGCWRWLLRREDSPWYPTLRLFRQHELGNWQPVVERVKEALSLRLKS